MSKPPKLLLAGDVGGTKTNLAIFAFDPEHESQPLKLVRDKRYPSADFDDLGAIVKKFLSSGAESVQSACFGVPGPVRNNRASPTNLKWEIDGAQLANDLEIGCVHLLNDLAANAYGISELGDSDFTTLQQGLKNAEGNRCIVSPGTGLGQAGLFWDGTKHRVWACEGGHTDFAPRTEVEIEMLRYLQARFGHVSNERVVSGLGIANIYGFLRDAGGFEETPEVAEALKTKPAAKVISAHAEAGTCKLCSRVIDLFSHCLAAEAANFALKAMATGGVYLGGGIPAKLIWKLNAQDFVETFNAKGRLEGLVETMPLHVILNDDAALLGAARFALDALAEAQTSDP